MGTHHFNRLTAYNQDLHYCFVSLLLSMGTRSKLTKHPSLPNAKCFANMENVIVGLLKTQFINQTKLQSAAYLVLAVQHKVARVCEVCVNFEDTSSSEDEDSIANYSN